MRQLFAAVFALITLAACATAPQDEWSRQQGVYNDLVDTAIDLRRPCVEIGPEADGCVINDEVYQKVEHFRVAADGYLKAADAQIELGEDDEARRYLASAWGALAALAANLGIAPPTEE